MVKPFAPIVKLALGRGRTFCICPDLFGGLFVSNLPIGFAVSTLAAIRIDFLDRVGIHIVHDVVKKRCRRKIGIVEFGSVPIDSAAIFFRFELIPASVSRSMRTRVSAGARFLVNESWEIATWLLPRAVTRKTRAKTLEFTRISLQMRNDRRCRQWLSMKTSMSCAIRGSPSAAPVNPPLR